LSEELGLISRVSSLGLGRSTGRASCFAALFAQQLVLCAVGAEGISERTLYRAKRELKNIVVKKDAADGGWTWRL
jgi:hypothetical protein